MASLDLILQCLNAEQMLKREQTGKCIKASGIGLCKPTRNLLAQLAVGLSQIYRQTTSLLGRIPHESSSIA